MNLAQYWLDRFAGWLAGEKWVSFPRLDNEARVWFTCGMTTQRFTGNLNGKWHTGGVNRGIGPCLVDVEFVDDGVHTPSYYVYIDGSHQCGGFAAHFEPAHFGLALTAIEGS